MNLIPTQPNPTWTIDRLRKHFGMIPAQRIVLDPPPGTATENDAFRLEKRGRVCELLDGVLVERPMGFEESSLAVWLGYWLMGYLEKNNLGMLVGEKAFFRLMPGLLRAADVAFITWDRLPKPVPRVAPVAPDLAVEVLSRGNTKKEMARKRREYFKYGARLVWEVNPRKQTVDGYTSLKSRIVLGIKDTLDGGDVLPGFKLRVSKLFSPPADPR